jgi:hypothetical protein
MLCPGDINNSLQIEIAALNQKQIRAVTVDSNHGALKRSPPPNFSL